MIYALTMSKCQRAMHWWLTLKEFGPKIQLISEVENIVAEKIRIFPSATNNQDEPRTIRDRYCANELFAINKDNNQKCGFNLEIYLSHI